MVLFLPPYFFTSLQLIFSVAGYLFVIGLVGMILYRHNLILLLMGLELILLAISFYFILYSLFLPNMLGQLITLILLTLAGAESAIGLALIMLLFRVKQDINLENIANLKY